jgi:hypothetical protein
LDHILEFDEKGLTVTCEPMVTFGDMTDFLMPRGYSLQTHVEMEAITIGGVTMSEKKCFPPREFCKTPDLHVNWLVSLN